MSSIADSNSKDNECYTVTLYTNHARKDVIHIEHNPWIRLNFISIDDRKLNLYAYLQSSKGINQIIIAKEFWAHLNDFTLRGPYINYIPNFIKGKK